MTPPVLIDPRVIVGHAIDVAKSAKAESAQRTREKQRALATLLSSILELRRYVLSWEAVFAGFNAGAQQTLDKLAEADAAVQALLGVDASRKRFDDAVTALIEHEPILAAALRGFDASFVLAHWTNFMRATDRWHQAQVEAFASAWRVSMMQATRELLVEIAELHSTAMRKKMTDALREPEVTIGFAAPMRSLLLSVVRDQDENASRGTS